MILQKQMKCWWLMLGCGRFNRIYRFYVLVFHSWYIYSICYYYPESMLFVITRIDYIANLYNTCSYYSSMIVQKNSTQGGNSSLDFFPTWVYFHKHSRITGLQRNGEGISLARHYHFQTFADTWTLSGRLLRSAYFCA